MGYTPRDAGRPGQPSTSVALRVSPGASQSEIVGRFGNGWKVRVAAQAERGRANDALLELLAEALGVPRGRLSVVAGRAARDKRVEVAGLGAGEAERRLAAHARKGDG